MEWTHLPLWMAAAGVATSTGFLGLVVAATLRFRRTGVQFAIRPDHFPPVTLLKPLCGLEPNLEANLTSFFQQHYPKFEIIFGVRDAEDPALDIVSKVKRKFPHVPAKIVITGEPKRANAKVCSLMKMYATASFDHFVISDSDVCVTSGYIEQVIRPLLQPETGLVTCLYRGVPTDGVWSRLEALGMSVEMTAGVLVANLIEGMKFALGPTMATRRDVLDRIGGFGILADYCADDYVLGAAVWGAGKEVVLSNHIIDHVVINRSLMDSLHHQVRWMKSTRFSRTWGHLGSVLTFSMPFGIVGLAAGIILHRPFVGVAIFLAAYLNRIALALAAGYGAVRDPRAARLCWLYPLRDLMGFGFWAASFLGRTIIWRGETYRLEHGGLMVTCGGDLAVAVGSQAEVETLSSTVAIDHIS